MRRLTIFCFLVVTIATMFFISSIGLAKEKSQIVHDAEYYILEAQNGKKWKAEDNELDKKLTKLQKKYGQPPNIVYILWDDTAFGAAGFPGLQKNHRAVLHAHSRRFPDRSPSGKARNGCSRYAP